MVLQHDPLSENKMKVEAPPSSGPPRQSCMDGESMEAERAQGGERAGK